ncbi:MAG TPA: glucose-1-phosphate adenylyltransferase [Candidatus Latescibacteria bacterium]|nr:glucose-1-phosphate adenylyltransferase [Candidatus Latescibacterota bacterium]HQK21891.1 glucose-1-phosphate adenylyltransferase [Candidatus Latescibacterota bacterium]
MNTTQTRFTPGALLRNTLTVILAGGHGTRLYPLTKHRAKPAVPFAGAYRIIDFTLSNCVNSGLRRVFVLTQYKSFSLDRHLQQGWSSLRYDMGEFILQLPPQERMKRSWYEGTADAIFQNLYVFQEQRPEYTVILSGDHVYLMDYAPMLAAHENTGADLTIAAIPVPRQDARRFGVLQVDASNRIVGFEEKPRDPASWRDDQTSLVSMGVYVFSTDVLVRRVLEDAKNPQSEHDFGQNIIPGMVNRDAVFAYSMPAMSGCEPYWRDIGTIDSYWQTSMDILRPDPPLNLYDPSWPVRTYRDHRPPPIVIDDGHPAGPFIRNSMVCAGARITSARIDRSIVALDNVVCPGADIEETVLMSRVRVGKGARIRRAIVDKDVDIPAGETIGYDLERERKRFLVTDNGIVVIPRGYVFD